MPATDELSVIKHRAIDEPLLGSHEEKEAGSVFPIFILSVATTVACLDHFYYTNEEGKQLIDISVHIIIFLGCFLFSRYQQDFYTELLPKTMFCIFLALLCLGFVDFASVVLSLTSLAMTIIVIVVNTWGLLSATPPEGDETATVGSEASDSYNNLDLLVV